MPATFTDPKPAEHVEDGDDEDEYIDDAREAEIRLEDAESDPPESGDEENLPTDPPPVPPPVEPPEDPGPHPPPPPAVQSGGVRGFDLAPETHNVAKCVVCGLRIEPGTWRLIARISARGRVDRKLHGPCVSGLPEEFKMRDIEMMTALFNACTSEEARSMLSNAIHVRSSGHATTSAGSAT